MTNEKTLYYYERTREQQAKVLAFNMIFLPFIMWLFLQFIPKTEPVYKQFLDYVKYIVVIGEVVLLAIIAWFLTHPAKFYIKLTNSEFSLFHPNFKEWTFSVSPHDIVEIGHSTDTQAQSRLISVKMKDESVFLLSPNFSYDRKELYASLRLVNPHIKTPKQVWLFSNKNL